MGVGDEQLGEEVVLVGRHADAAFAAARLRPIGRQRRALDVAEPRHRDDHVLLLDQVLDVDVVVFAVLDRRAPRRREALLDRDQLLLEHLEQARARAQDVQQLPDAIAELVELVGDLGALELGQAMQAEIEDRLGLALRQAIGPRRIRVRRVLRRLFGEAQQRGDVAQAPVARAQLGLGGRGVGRGPDQSDDLVDVGDRDCETEQDVGALASAREIVGAAARDHLLAELEEGDEHVLEIELQRPPADERHQVDPIAHLQGRVPEQLIEHDVRIGLALQLDHHPGAVAIRLVAHLGDPLDPPLAHQLADALEHAPLVDLIGHLADDDGVAVLAHLLDVGPAAHQQAAASGEIRLADAACGRG